ncbi:MAG: 3-oxoacyl-ACP reductase FabG [Rhodospirillaceae bacterium]|jgi:3-oxoacyl-[acyl-carrier protein] reductase|nr:3-oxoacyl-ACP reductase FabG [Rhodospirillaceae bacterium]|tara:strand:+ start:56 stop:790 length:735 start_codon:yes stop_codon:yes gene_type:complete
MNETSEQIVLVTGASKGIGKAIAVELGHKGRFVHVNYNSDEKGAKETCEQIKKNGGKAKLTRFNVKDAAECEIAVKEILKANDKIDILVNNAGIKNDKLLAFMQESDWKDVLDTNLASFFNVTKLIVKTMITKRFGRIINITSTAGQVGNAGQVNYSASKAGIIGATKALAKEVAKRNITVNAVSPGFIETGMLDGMPIDEIKKMIPCQRLGKVEEVSALVGFLCSKEASYISGQVIGVNGGVT